MAVALALAAQFALIHRGKHWDLFARPQVFERYRADISRFFDFAEQVFERIEGALGLKFPRRRYNLLVHEYKGKGLDGFATGHIRELEGLVKPPAPGIGVIYDAFFNEFAGIKGYWGYVLIAHETVNLYTGQVLGGGWPVDWWADHKSPFPAMVAVELLFDIKPEVAVVHHRLLSRDTLYMAFRRLKSDFGWAMFRRALRYMREDGIVLDRLGKNPSRLRTDYVAAYLVLGASEDITPILVEAGVGTLDPEEALAIARARQELRALKQVPGKAWELFRDGRWREALRLARSAKGKEG